MKACCKENWDYSLTMRVAILPPDQAKGVTFHFLIYANLFRFVLIFVAVKMQAQTFRSLKNGWYFFKSTNLELCNNYI